MEHKNIFKRFNRFNNEYRTRLHQVETWEAIRLKSLNGSGLQQRKLIVNQNLMLILPICMSIIFEFYLFQIYNGSLSIYLSMSIHYLSIYLYFGRCPWCNGYRRREWTWRLEFKSWTRMIAFHIALILLGKV